MSKKCTPLWREAHLEVKSVKNWRSRSTFGSWDVEKVHAIVARSTFRSQNVKNTRGLGALLEVQMSFRVPGARDCAPCQKVLYHVNYNHHYTTQHSNTLHYTTTTTTPSLHSTTLHSTTLHCTQLHSITLHYTTLHYITLNDTAPQIDR